MDGATWLLLVSGELRTEGITTACMAVFGWRGRDRLSLACPKRGLSSAEVFSATPGSASDTPLVTLTGILAPQYSSQRMRGQSHNLEIT